MGKVQIEESLFFDLCRYHLLGIRDDGMERRIRAGLEAKTQSMAKRQEYRKNLDKTRP